MKKISILFILSLFLFSGCDFEGSFIFIIRNSTDETITLKFLNKTDFLPYETSEEMILLPSEEKIVRVIPGKLNSPAHDCLTMHGMGYFKELVFDTYVNEIKLEKQLWQAENWTYSSTSKWNGEYRMIITNKMIDK